MAEDGGEVHGRSITSLPLSTAIAPRGQGMPPPKPSPINREQRHTAETGMNFLQLDWKSNFRCPIFIILVT